MTLFKTAFGYNLRLIRKSKGLTQEKLSEMIGLNQRQLTRIETGESFVSSNVLEKLVVALGLEFKDLFDFEFDLRPLESTGTDSMPYFRVSKIKNVVKVQQFKSEKNKMKIKESTLVGEGHDEFLSGMAHKLDHSINVQYFEEGMFAKTYIYHSDGKVEFVKNKEIRAKAKSIEKILGQIKKISMDERQFEYLKLAIDSLSSRASRKKLKAMIEGMDLRK